jgi:PEP-CTERM motif-containing protein
MWGKVMTNRVLLLLVAGFVFTFASPSYATFWKSQGGSRSFGWSGQNEGSQRDCDRDRSRDRVRLDWSRLVCDQDQQPQQQCDDNRRDRWNNDNRRDGWGDWCDNDRERPEECKVPDWNWGDGKDWGDCKPRKCRPKCDNPVPEPATAGLSLMGLGGLIAAIRRRRL